MSTASLLRELEQLARKWETGDVSNPAEDLRNVAVHYLRPDMRVFYRYASQWRTGTLLTRPSEGNPCWQIQRDGFGGYIDQVDTNSYVRILVESES